MSEGQGRLSVALAHRYTIERELGRGGMAIVYLAHDIRHDRPVAMKMLHPELTASLGPERFLREVRTTARLDHPHILPLLDSGETEGLLWYTMPRPADRLAALESRCLSGRPALHPIWLLQALDYEEDRPR